VIDGLDTSVVNEEFLKQLRAGGVDCVHKSIGNLDGIADLYGFAYKHRKELVIAKTVGEILRARDDGKLSFIMGSQAANYFEKALYARNLASFTNMAQAVRAFKGLGVGIQGLCYNTTNVFGSGCLNHEAPLTRAGRRLVELIHENQIILDVGGHTSERTSLDAIEMSSGVPVVCTHTNFAALNPNRRNISDRLAEAIARTGGVIGITAISAYHTHNEKTRGKKDRQATLSEHLDHYDHAKRLLGFERVGLGPDFVWGWGETRKLDPDDSWAFPDDVMPTGLRSIVKDFENISKLPNLVRGLKERGWAEKELHALLGGNWLRIYKQVWGS
jgi:membrane dipeptidase